MWYKNTCPERDLISWSHRADMNENQTQNLILSVVELQCKLNSQPHRVSTAKVRAMVGKKMES